MIRHLGLKPRGIITLHQSNLTFALECSSTKEVNTKLSKCHMELDPLILTIRWILV